MARLRVTPEARRDLLEIAEFTLERWGDVQCEKYLRQLWDRMKALASMPTLGRKCDSIRAGYWKYHSGRHVIFYVVGERSVDVIRVLHDQMLPRRHF